MKTMTLKELNDFQDELLESNEMQNLVEDVSNRLLNLIKQKDVDDPDCIQIMGSLTQEAFNTLLSLEFMSQYLDYYTDDLSN